MPRFSDTFVRGIRRHPRVATCLALALWSIGRIGAAFAALPEPWNAPYPVTERAGNVAFGTFQERPKHLDPVSSYSENEAVFTAQVYEPPLQYHFLQRPYALVPLTAQRVPVPIYYDRAGHPLPDDAPEQEIVAAKYVIQINPGIRYAPHPAFARDGEGKLRYHALAARAITNYHNPNDFLFKGTRELVADDYVYQIKRLVHPRLHSPIAGFMAKYIQGLDELAAHLQRADPGAHRFLDLRKFALAGARALDRYSFEITLTGKYPQFVYWLAMPFFAPVPWEADAFYAQPGMAARNLSLDWYPVGTGPYYLRENNPNRRIVLARNPQFHAEYYPSNGEATDASAGYLADAGHRLPFIDEIQFMLEKEDIPEWTKFLQGYYDGSPIAPDGFDQAVRFDADGKPELTPALASRHIALSVATQMSVTYLGFNWLDPVVGGTGARARGLRQALAIAIDFEEMISIFSNGRGIPAQGPLPPGIFGHLEGRAGINPLVYEWRDGRAVRRPLQAARDLLAAAGYPEGIDPVTGKPLVLHFDAPTTGVDQRSLFDWYRKQFARLGIELVVRATDYNRFQDKMRRGQAQIFAWGWNADYPDPENFLFLLYGPNGKAEFEGENAANYRNPDFDLLFTQMKDLANGEPRQQVIDRMLEIVRHDSPWLWGVNPQAYSLQHVWVRNAKPNLMARNLMKYRRIDGPTRAALQAAWNQPRIAVLWWCVVVAAVVAGVWIRSRQPQALP